MLTEYNSASADKCDKYDKGDKCWKSDKLA